VSTARQLARVTPVNDDRSGRAAGTERDEDRGEDDDEDVRVQEAHG
jgi:hypothetical protein